MIKEKAIETLKIESEAIDKLIPKIDDEFAIDDGDTTTGSSSSST